MRLSVHDVLEAWQEARITARRAMQLTGATNVLELYAVAEDCDVTIRMGLTEADDLAVARAGKAIGEAFARDGDAALALNVA